MTYAAYPFIATGAYLLGGINPAYIYSRSKGFDIRDKGTGNPGASNAMVLFGRKVGLITALLDIMKAYLAIILASALFPQTSLAKEVAGVSCILGHMFPVQMKFKGGKGLACLGGTVLAYSPLCFLIMICSGTVLALLTGYLAVVPILASIAFPIIYKIYGGSTAGTVLYMIPACVMIAKHIENIRRIRSGEEIRISVLWNREREIDRVNDKKNEKTQRR